MLKRRAELQGVPFNKKLEDIEKEILDDIRFSETGGQTMRDIERLYEDNPTTDKIINIGESENSAVRVESAGDVPAKIFIGDLPKPVPVRISLTHTKIFGVLPIDVDPPRFRTPFELSATISRP
ncbi:hypothetical protein [Methylobacter sp.]|uniref:hypothetical protein n=1 Tax=Methylobacter sp. TaxID=2051955 RepID=UPI003DA5B9B0